MTFSSKISKISSNLCWYILGMLYNQTYGVNILISILTCTVRKLIINEKQKKMSWQFDNRKIQLLFKILYNVLTSVPCTFNFIWSSRVVFPSFRFFQQYPSLRYLTFFRLYNSIDPLFGLKRKKYIINYDHERVKTNNNFCY